MPDVAQNDLAAAILVGGRSRRMGTNKALIRLDPDGPTVLESVAATLARITDHILLVGSEPGIDLPRIPRIADTVPGHGVLGGIHTALTATDRSHVLVVACDMPFLNMDLLREMAAHPRDYDVLVPLLRPPQPLHAIYARTCLPVIEDCLQAGQFKATGWFPRVTVRALGKPAVRNNDPLLRSWFNMNTPEDVLEAREMLADESIQAHS